jgi:hypothetical protein
MNIHSTIQVHEHPHSSLHFILLLFSQGFLCCLCIRKGLTTFEEEEDAGATWEEEESSDEISESPRDVEVNRYNSSIHAEPFPGQPYSR